MTSKGQTPDQIYAEALGALTPKQRRFVAEYLDCLNASEAARRAQYQTKPNVQGPRMLANASIRAAVDAGMLLYSMPAPEILYRLTREARGSMEDFLRVDEEEITLTWSLLEVPQTEDGEIDVGGAVLKLASQENVKPTDRILHTATVKRTIARLDLLEAGKRGKLDLIKEYSVDEKGKVSIKLYDAQTAKQLLGKTQKLFIEKTEHMGAVTLKVEYGSDRSA